MTKLSGVERMLKALSRQVPDRVPHFDVHNKKVREAILPDASYEEFIEYMDLDGIMVLDKVNAWTYEKVDDSGSVKRDQWGALVRYTSEDLGVPVQYAIKTEKDLENYNVPDPDDPNRYKWLQQVVKRFKGERAIMAHATDVFDIAKESFLGDEAYFEAIVNNPELVDQINKIVLDYNLRYLKNCIEIGADIILISGDYAMTHSLFVSPKHTARFLIPSLTRQVELAHGFNVPIIKHTDGNIWKIFDLIVDTGVDGLHPIDPMAGMDIGEAKEKYGRKICLCGNINCGETLCWGTEEQVREEVKECIRKAAPGGGYICVSSNSIHSGVKPGNYLAMVKAIREYGDYPIELD